MLKSRPYYTLAIREHGRWAPQFGDYERSVVAQEARDGYSQRRASDRKIVASLPDCDAIDAAIATLNHESAR